MKEERPKMAVEEPSSDYSCSNFIVAAIHMAFVMASCMASLELIKPMCMSPIWLEH